MDPVQLQQQLADQRRGRYVRVSDEDRRQLIETYKKGEDFIALAKKLNIKRSTARSILRTYIDEGRVSAKQRAGTRLRFITESEATMIREMKRRHPLITIGQIQMRLQRTSTRVLSKASISRILTNSVRLGKRAKYGNEGGDDEHDDYNEALHGEQSELMHLSSDEGTGEAIYIDDGLDDDEDDDDEEVAMRTMESHASMQNLDDFQRFMLYKSGVNEEESMGNEVSSWNGQEQSADNGYAAYDSENEDETSETDEHESKSLIEPPSDGPPTHLNNHGTRKRESLHRRLRRCSRLETLADGTEPDAWTAVKSEPVCVFVNRTLDSSDSEQPAIANEIPTKRYLSPSASPSPLPRIPSLFSILNTQSTANRRVKVCPICGEQNFSRLSHHLTVAHNLNREESLTLLAYADRTNNNSSNNQSSIPLVSSSSPKHLDRSPQQTPISINTNNQQIPSTGFSPLGIDGDLNSHTVTVIPSSSPREQQLSNHSPRDGKKRLLCPRCDTWVLNLTDHLIKKHHLVSKQERLPYLRLARSRATENNAVKLTTNHSLATGANDSPTPPVANKDYQNIVQKYRKQLLNSVPAPSSSLPTHETAPSTSPPKVAVHQKFEQRLSVFRQQFAVTVAMQNSLMQQMELLQRSFVSIEDEWNDMKKEIVDSIS